jgi:hypothetical protein
MREPTKPRPIEIDLKRIMRYDQHIYTHIEFLVSYQQRVMNVALHDVCLRLVRIVRPVRDIPDGPEQKDALALTPSNLNHPTITGFIIQVTFCYLQRLNSSRNIGYSLGILYVSGK